MTYWRSCALSIVLLGVASVFSRSPRTRSSLSTVPCRPARCRPHRTRRTADGRADGIQRVQSPPRIAIDLPGVGNAMGKSSVEVNQGNLRSVNVAQSGERTRLVLNLKQPRTIGRSCKERSSSAARQPAGIAGGAKSGAADDSVRGEPERRPLP